MQTRQKTTSNQTTGAAPTAAVDPFAAGTAQNAQTMPGDPAAQAGAADLSGAGGR